MLPEEQTPEENTEEVYLKIPPTESFSMKLISPEKLEQLLAENKQLKEENQKLKTISDIVDSKIEDYDGKKDVSKFEQGEYFAFIFIKQLLESKPNK